MNGIKHISLSAAFLCAFCVFMTVSCATNQGFRGITDFHGTVTYDGGKPGSGFELTLSNGEREKKTSTSAEGKFVFPAVKSGTYQLSAEKDGFEPVCREVTLTSRVVMSAVRTFSFARLCREAEKKLDSYNFTSACRYFDRAETAGGSSELLTMYRVVCLFKQQEYEKAVLLAENAKKDGTSGLYLAMTSSLSKEKIDGKK